MRGGGRGRTNRDSDGRRRLRAGPAIACAHSGQREVAAALDAMLESAAVIPQSEAAGLLDPAFVRELEALRRRLEIRARSGGGGEHLARRKGSSAEFQEHRAYAPGDDMRRIDWAAYARTGEPVLKLFRAEEDVIARLVVDGSASLGFGEPSQDRRSRGRWRRPWGT